MSAWNMIEIMLMYKDLVLTQGREHANTCLVQYVPSEHACNLIIASVDDDGNFLDTHGKPMKTYLTRWCEPKEVKCEMHTAGNGQDILVFKGSPAKVNDRLLIRYNGTAKVLFDNNGTIILKWDDPDINGRETETFQYKVEQ
jgi:hypothetical protein